VSIAPIQLIFFIYLQIYFGVYLDILKLATSPINCKHWSNPFIEKYFIRQKSEKMLNIQFVKSKFRLTQNSTECSITFGSAERYSHVFCFAECFSAFLNLKQWNYESF